MHKTKALRQESYYHGCFAKQIRDQIYHSLYILYNIWSKALLFFEPRLLTICLIAMYCNGDIKKSIEVSILFKQNFVMPNNFYL